MIRGKKLGILLSAHPAKPNFQRAAGLAEAALAEGADVYFYCIDDAVLGLGEPNLQTLKPRGLKLYACALAAQRRHIPVNEAAIFGGLAIVQDIMAETDCFVSFS